MTFGVHPMQVTKTKRNVNLINPQQFSAQYEKNGYKTCGMRTNEHWDLYDVQFNNAHRMVCCSPRVLASKSKSKRYRVSHGLTSDALIDNKARWPMNIADGPCVLIVSLPAPAWLHLPVFARKARAKQPLRQELHQLVLISFLS